MKKSKKKDRYLNQLKGQRNKNRQYKMQWEGKRHENIKNTKRKDKEQFIKKKTMNELVSTTSKIVRHVSQTKFKEKQQRQ